MEKTMAARSVWWISLILFSACFMGLVPMAFAGSVWDQETNGSISGYVEDPWGNSVPGIPVVAFADPCWTNWAGEGLTDQNGDYTISDLPVGDYYVVAQAKCHTAGHLLDQWWNNANGTPDCDRAAPVNVSGTTDGIDFFLEQGTPYPAPVFDIVDMFSNRNPDGSVRTVFYAFVAGPSPEDVCCFTVSGPGGTFYLEPSISFKQRGLLYGTSLDFAVPDGMYTFMLTDTMGHSISATRDFVYNNAVPQIDPDTMYPADGSYVSTTPVLGADPVVVIQDSEYPAPFKYQLQIRDYHNNAVWYSSEYLDNPTFQVPEGVLQPNTPYFWFIRVIDTNTQARNRTQSPMFSFFTGPQGVPLLEDPVVVSMPPSHSGWEEGYYFGVQSRNTAPWDVDYLQIRDECGRVYPWTGLITYWFTHPCYFGHLLWSETPIPDGTYTFEMANGNGDTDTATRSYVYGPVPEVSEETRHPHPNAYLDTQTPTFSWDPISGDASYRYRLRIRDFNRRIVWYDSPFSTETNVALPEWLRLPRGSSYKWQVITIDAEGNNVAYSRARTFTLNSNRFPWTDIKANGSDGPLTAASGTPVSITVSLNPGEFEGFNADFWIAVHTPFPSPGDWYTYVHPTGWQQGVHRCTQAPLFPFFDVEVLNLALTPGSYTFYFAVDPPDGVPTAEVLDSVQVRVQPQ
ncbi:MAG: carboxypeptidase regulatory-like domain-containing protein [Deltaproteobacteria bacterium]|nr:carboxypeptidase regulatory-like domain-containing protein [Deltaproteobacteria bacterium]